MGGVKTPQYTATLARSLPGRNLTTPATSAASAQGASPFHHARRRGAKIVTMAGMDVLVINCGSSSIKFKVYALDDGPPRARVAGLLDRVGGAATLRVGAVDAGAAPTPRPLGPVPDHAAGMRAILAELRAAGLLPLAPRAIGHRVVHGGAHFSGATRIDTAVLDALWGDRRR